MFKIKIPTNKNLSSEIMYLFDKYKYCKLIKHTP